jgi:low temperature requirement protein LtrA
VGAQVSPLELFFDLVFVLAITQCSALMANRSDWEGVAQGLLVLALLWWTWVGYAWLTSVVDPDVGLVRLVVFTSMAGLLVVGLCVPEVFDDLALTFAIAYGVVRVAHIALFVVASRDDPDLRHSVAALAVSTAIGVSLIVAASFLDGAAQGGLWVAALTLDLGGPYLFGSEGWKLEPAHFVERHGLVVIIALGESIVVLGIASEVGMTAGVIAAAVLGVALAAGMWWLYFDLGSLVVGEVLERTPPGRELNELARDAYSYLHFPLVAGIVLVALGLEHTLAHVDEPLDTISIFALIGGFSLYALGHVAVKRRALHAWSVPRLLAGLGVLAFIPLARSVDALVTLTAVVVVAWLLVGYETVHYAAVRNERRGRGAA